MIHVIYTRKGQVFNWLQCDNVKQLKRWMKALLKQGPISNVKIEVR